MLKKRKSVQTELLVGLQLMYRSKKEEESRTKTAVAVKWNDKRQRPETVDDLAARHILLIS